MGNTIALVTGASKGIGLEVAKQLGQKGIHVLVGARTQSVADAAAVKLQSEGIEAHGAELEVTNAVHIETIARFIEETYGRLDILVNNAGVMPEMDGDAEDAFRNTFEVNTYAPYYLTKALLPLLLKSEAGRIVNTSSALGSIQLNLSNDMVQRIATPAYAASKAALNMLTVYWANRTKGTPVKVNSVHPGLVKTRMGGEKAELTPEEGAKTTVRLATLPPDGPSGGFFYQNQQLP